jgi:hypothetical protein
MNKLLTLIDKGVNKEYFRWLWIIGAASWLAFMVFVVIVILEQKVMHKSSRWYEDGVLVIRDDGMDIMALVKDALHPVMIAFYAFIILTPFLVKWIGQWIYKAVRKKEEKIK